VTASAAHQEGKTSADAPDMSKWPQITVEAAAKKTGLRGKRFKANAAKRPPGT